MKSNSQQQTDIRTFRAATMQEALDIVRRELGGDAVILHTRELPQPRFFRWRKSKERIEVTAGSGVNIAPPRRIEAPAARSQAARTPPAQATGRTPASELAPPPDLLALKGRSVPPLPAMGAPASAGLPRPAQQAPQQTPPPAPRPASDQEPRPAGRNWAPPAADNSQNVLARRLGSIEQMVTHLARESFARGDDVPGELFHLYTDLIDAEVDEELAREMIRRLKQAGSPEQLANAAAARVVLRNMVESEIRCAEPIRATRGRRRVVALVGPTGVGKTTTIAKLAANFRLREGARMGLVTVDTYRIAAVEQLRTYAEIIDLPMKVVTGPREMRRALDELAGLDLVLIDTAGRSPRDDLKIQELKSLLAEAQVDEVHLVLSLVASAKSLASTAEKFAPAGTTAMILTKLDEAAGTGSLLSVARRVPLPISYLTTGQDVPDDIEHAGVRRIARLVLGEENVIRRPRAAA
jgi:flagellar biosynthesis protein FlhF